MGTNVLRRLVTLLAASALLWGAFGAPPSPAAASEVKVLLIGADPDHPHGSHMYLHTCRVLAQCLEAIDGVEAVVSNGWPQDAAVLDGVRAIVLYTPPGAELLLDGPHRDQVDRLMRAGVGLVTIHWASTVREPNLERLGDRWLSYLGGTWISNVGLSTETARLRQLEPDHPICRGWSEYDLHDEYYLNPVLTDGATPLLQVSAGGQEVVVGWAYERGGGGRSYATTLGHYYRNFQRDEFRRMVVNAILWTAGLDVPPGGAPVVLSDEALALPPE